MASSPGGDYSLPPGIARNLGDKAYEKRKNAALEISSLVKGFMVVKEGHKVTAMISTISKEFVRSKNSNQRKGGLIV